MTDDDDELDPEIFAARAPEKHKDQADFTPGEWLEFNRTGEVPLTDAWIAHKDLDRPTPVSEMTAEQHLQRLQEGDR